MTVNTPALEVSSGDSEKRGPGSVGSFSPGEPWDTACNDHAQLMIIYYMGAFSLKPSFLWKNGHVADLKIYWDLGP